MELKKALGYLELNAHNVVSILSSCKVTPETKNVMEARTFPKDSAMQGVVLKLDEDKVRTFKPLIRYLLGQLRNVHVNQRQMSLSMCTINYRGKQWTTDPKVLQALYFLGTSTSFLPYLDEKGCGKLLIHTVEFEPPDKNSTPFSTFQVFSSLFGDFSERGLYATYAPSDPKFQVKDLAERALFCLGCFDTQKDTVDAAHRGDAQAQFELAEKLYDWAPASYRETAKAWYSQAAVHGHAEATYKLALMTNDPNEQMSLYTSAGLLGHAESQYRVANHCLTNEKDTKKAVLWYEMAAKQRNYLSLCKLVDIYIDGEGNVPPDPVQATHWVIKWCDHPLTSRSGSFEKLKKCYEEGIRLGSAGQHSQAFEIIHAIAEYAYSENMEECAPAFYLLGMIYREGTGVSRDRYEARKWLQRAADMGHDEARRLLCQL